MEEVKEENILSTTWKRRWAILRWGISQNMAFIDYFNLPQDVITKIKLDCPYSAEDYPYSAEDAHQNNIPEVFRP